MNRRQFIGSTAITGTGMIAGCLVSPSDSYATLQRFLLVNARNEPVVMELRIEHNDADERIHDDTYEISSGLTGVPVDCVWPDEPLRILARNAEDEEWNTFSTADRDGCLLLYAEIHDHGTSFFRATEECPVRSPDCHTDVEG